MKKDLKVAIVTDWMHRPGGADRFIKSLRKIFPNSVVFTSMYFPNNYKNSWMEIDYEVRESFLSKLPFKNALHRHFSVLTPFAFENLDLSGFDLVVSVTAGQAKCIITDVEQPHVSIILTPPRYLWDFDSNMRTLPLKWLYELLSPIVRSWLRIADQLAVRRIDEMISISKYIDRKIQKHYRRESDVIYPGISEYWFEPLDKNFDPNIELPEKYFVVISRLMEYKRIDRAIRACIETGDYLVISGEGQDLKFLKKLAKNHENIRFIGRGSDDFSKHLMTHAEAFIFCGIEDFGFTPIEAMACGTPVIAYNEGGVTETVLKGQNGEFFKTQHELNEILMNFDAGKYKKSGLVARAKEFTETVSNEKYKAYFEKFINERF